MIPERFIQDCEIVTATGASVGDLLTALREQHVAVEDCNERLDKARAANARGQ